MDQKYLKLVSSQEKPKNLFLDMSFDGTAKITYEEIWRMFYGPVRKIDIDEFFAGSGVLK